jgi:hypothetical protein
VAIIPQADREGSTTWPREGGAAPTSSAERAWPLPARWIDHLALDSTETTLVYWAGVALVTSGLFVTKLLPCVDYPQHLALSDVARRLGDPGAPEHAEYVLNYFTYNGLFHFVVGWLSTRLSIELAGKVVVAVSLVATAGAVVALVRVLRRPPIHAVFFTPILFSFSLGWGFVNYVLATAVAAWALVFVARTAVRPSMASVGAVGALGSLCAFAHVFAMLILCAMACALAPELAWRAAPTGARHRRPWMAAVRTTLAVAPLLIGCIYCIEVYREQYPWDPNMYRDPTIEGSAPSLWEKVFYFSAFATDLFGDGSDQLVLWVTVAVMVWVVRMGWKAARSHDSGSDEPPPIVAPFAAMTLAYFATPMVLIGTHLIFPRLAQWVILGALLAMPRLPERLAERARAWLPRLGLVAGVNTLVHCALFGWETGDASATIDDLPQGRAATAVIWDPWTFAFRNGTLTHLAAYYAARKHGQWAFAFARYLSVPVRFKPSSQPAWPAVGWEFDAESYDPRCKYARAFPLVIVKAPEELPRDASGEPWIRALVFKQDRDAVRLLSHHGHYWAFDTTGLPDDGRL